MATSSREFWTSEPPRRSLLSRLLAQRLLQQLQPLDEEQPVLGDATLEHLNRSASPQLALCLAPECGPCDLLVLTLLHRRQPTGPTHDPYRAVVERWARPAAHYLRPPSVPTAAESVETGAASGGNAGALAAALAALRSALQPRLRVDPHDWSLLWRQELPGTAEQMAMAADGGSMAVGYQQLVEEGMRHTVRLWQLRWPHERPHPSWQCSARSAERAGGGGADGSGLNASIAEGAGVAAGAPPPWEDIPLPGSAQLSALSLVSNIARDECFVYARALDRHAFRMLCRSRRRRRTTSTRGSGGGGGSWWRWPWRRRAAALPAPDGATAAVAAPQQPKPAPHWRTMLPGPAVDRRRGYTETVLLRSLALPSQPGMGPLLVGQLSPTGIGHARYGLGLSLQLYSPLLLTRPCGLLARLFRPSRCSEPAWTLRAATAANAPRSSSSSAASSSSSSTSAASEQAATTTMAMVARDETTTTAPRRRRTRRRRSRH